MPSLLQVVFGEKGVLEGLSAGKGYVDMSTVDEGTSQRIAEAVAAKGGRFLEVRPLPSILCGDRRVPLSRTRGRAHTAHAHVSAAPAQLK